MKPITTMYADREYDVIEAFLNLKKKYLDVREWVTVDDLYVDEHGDVYYVELYDTEYSREEGHGQHDVIGHQEPKEYKILVTCETIKYATQSGAVEVEEEKEPSKLVWALMFLVLSLMAWVLLYASQGLVNFN